MENFQSMNLSDIKESNVVILPTGCNDEFKVPCLKDQTFKLRVENNVNQNNGFTVGTKVTGVMNLGGPFGLVFSPNLSLNMNNLVSKSVLGTQYGVNMNWEDFNGFVKIQNGNSTSVGTNVCGDPATQLNVKTVLETGNGCGNVSHTFQMNKGFGWDEADAVKEASSQENDLMTVGFNGKFDLSGVCLNSEVTAELINGATQKFTGNLSAKVDCGDDMDATMKFSLTEDKANEERKLKVELKGNCTGGDVAFEPKVTFEMPMSTTEKGTAKPKVVKGALNCNTDMTGNDMTLELSGDAKLSEKTEFTAKAKWSMELDGPTEGATITPFASVEWKSKDARTHASAGLTFTSSLSALGTLFGN